MEKLKQESYRMNRILKFAAPISLTVILGIGCSQANEELDPLRDRVITNALVHDELIFDRIVEVVPLNQPMYTLEFNRDGSVLAEVGVVISGHWVLEEDGKICIKFDSPLPHSCLSIVEKENGFVAFSNAKLIGEVNLKARS